MIDRVVAELRAGACSRCRSASSGSRRGCSTARVCFGGEESAGASFLRRDGTVWTTDKDGPIMDLLAAEITARTGQRSRRALPRADGRIRRAVLHAHRRAGDARAEGAARRSSRPRPVDAATLAGEPITAKLTRAPGNGAPIGGLKVVAPQRLVRRAAVGHGGHLQDLRGELPRRSATLPPSSPRRRRSCAPRWRAS